MYTLPAKTSIRLRHPGRHLAAWVATVVAPATRVFRAGRISVELTDWVERARAWPRHVYRWYGFTTGATTPIFEEYRPFEIDPGYALVAVAGDDVMVHLTRFTDDREVHVALDVARDALLEGRDTVALRILRDALPHGWPLFAALVRKERNLLAAR